MNKDIEEVARACSCLTFEGQWESMVRAGLHQQWLDHARDVLRCDPVRVEVINLLRFINNRSYGTISVRSGQLLDRLMAQTEEN